MCLTGLALAFTLAETSKADYPTQVSQKTNEQGLIVSIDNRFGAVIIGPEVVIEGEKLVVTKKSRIIVYGYYENSGFHTKWSAEGCYLGSTFLLSADGSCFVTFDNPYPSIANYTTSDPVLAFYKNGNLLAIYSLNDIVGNIRKLRKAVSYYIWMETGYETNGHIVSHGGIDDSPAKIVAVLGQDNIFRFLTTDGYWHFYDANTGTKIDKRDSRWESIQRSQPLSVTRGKRARWYDPRTW